MGIFKNIEGTCDTVTDSVKKTPLANVGQLMKRIEVLRVTDTERITLEEVKGS